MKKIRILALLLVLSMALSMSAFAAYGGGFVWSVSVDKTTLSVGDTAEVTVYLAPGQDYYEYNSAEIYLKWDPNVLSVSEVKGLKLFKATAFTDENDTHMFINRYTNSTTSMISWTDTAPVATFTVTAIANGSSELALYRSQITQTVQYVPVPVESSTASAVRVTVGDGQSTTGGDTPITTGTQNLITPAQNGTDSTQTKQQPTVNTKITSFADVPPSHWANEAVTFCCELGLFTGTSATTFTPDGAVTRGMFMTVLARAAGVQTDGGATWYEKGQLWAMENEVSDGTNPELPLTREQLVTMLYRFGGSPITDGSIGSYPDAATASDFSYDALCWATKYGIINGINGNLSPKTGATRAQLAAILMRWSMVEY